MTNHILPLNLGPLRVEQTETFLDLAHRLSRLQTTSPPFLFRHSWSLAKPRETGLCDVTTLTSQKIKVRTVAKRKRPFLALSHQN